VVSNPLCEEFQDVDYWISQAPYSTSTAGLADAVKMLIISNEMLALLRLANHEKIPLGDLNHLSWGHSFGVTHVADVALEIYMLLNIAASVKANAKPGSANDTGCLRRRARSEGLPVGDWVISIFQLRIYHIGRFGMRGALLMVLSSHRGTL
jgi:hypothetical protein